MTIKPRGQKNTITMRKRVPKRYASVEDRKEVWISLHTDSSAEGKLKADLVWREQIEAWEATLAGESRIAEDRLAGARKIAEARGFSYRPMAAIASGPVDDILARVEAIPVSKGKPMPTVAAALLGAVKDPGLRVSNTLELFWELTKADMIGKSEDQIRRARNPVIKAVRNFIAVVGDKPIAEINRDDMLDFRQWWSERLETEDLSAGSANKDLTHFGKVLRRVNELKRLSLDLPLEGLAFRSVEGDRRPPFSTDWIRSKILAPGALAGMNTEARCILLGMINTGYRPSEGAALLPHHIKLDTAVPHIEILPEGRQIKTRSSNRVIPLAGVSLEAMRECRGGFPRYRDKPGLSATINNYLRENKLMETKDHVLYSLRHSFEDRLLAAGVDERIRRDLMGHSLGRERYGAGASLEQALGMVQRVAL
jgi:integrase